MSLSITISRPRAWLESLRLRTLPLALASIVMGSALAWWQHKFKLNIALMALLTTSLLQILSNLANDYGDAQKGSDTVSRLGPLRGMQKGLITQAQMKQALIITVLLTAVSGVTLIVIACDNLQDMLGFLLLGLLAIVAAITYTVGTRPYGYMGLGDISVLIFFGWLSVAGTYYLQTGNFDLVVMLPASACGFLAVAVLNINNLRDIENDALSGKNTLAVRLGSVGARYYHLCLLLGSVICLVLFALIDLQSGMGWLFVLATPMLYQHARYVLCHQDPEAMRPMLENMVKNALMMNLLFAVGTVLSTQ